MEHKVFQAMEMKVDAQPGTFSGYASIFKNVDLGGDVITPGAFKEIIANKDGMVKMLYNHDSGGMFGGSGSGGLPIGLARVEQNTKGLKFSGELVMEDPFVSQRVYPHLKAGSLDGMSIGYDILPGGARMLESGARELNALRLWEISPVVWGMNPKAHVADVKSVRNLREVEDLLRDAVGLSRTQAKRHAAAIWETVRGQREAGEADSLTAQELLGHIRGLELLTQ